MNKLFKTIGMLSLVAIITFTGIGAVKAATGSTNLRISSTRVLVNNTVTVTATIASTSSIGAWNATLSYDSAHLKIISSNASGQQMVGYGDGSIKSKVYTFTFKAVAAGSTQVYISAANILDYVSEAEIATTKGSVTTTVITQAQLEASYSTNNYLSALSITGGTLTPVFNRATLEYAVELVPDTAKVVINATKEDNSATVTGTGDVLVNDGSNRIEIKVNAQNGSLRTYVINATVKEFNPIEVTIDNQKLTVVRKKSALVAPANYTETTLTLGTEIIPAFTNEITKFVLVGLKDAAGIINYYIYDANAKTYTLYQELAFNKITIYPMLMNKEDIPRGYTKTTIKYNDKDLVVYKYKNYSDYSLVYGMNLEDGLKHVYMLDSKENTLQIYNNEHIKDLINSNDKYFMTIIALAILSTVMADGIIIYGIKQLNNNSKKTKSIESKIKNLDKLKKEVGTHTIIKLKDE